MATIKVVERQRLVITELRTDTGSQEICTGAEINNMLSTVTSLYVHCIVITSQRNKPKLPLGRLS